MLKLNQKNISVLGSQLIKSKTKKNIQPTLTQAIKVFFATENNEDVIVMCANRGEIATRVFRATKEQGFKSLGVYSSADKKSLHRQKADHVVELDSMKSPVAQYLDMDNLIKIAKKHKVSIIHPGYGFLSENQEFAKKIEEAGLLFAGPPSDVIEFFGDKINAKKLAKKHNIPVAEGTEKPVDTLEEAKKVCEKITFPVMIKAASGGGGRGIRVAKSESDLEDAFERAKSEAKSNFGNDSVFIEKFVEEPRHIEVQILADNYGNVVHLFERDCSVQRRNQKVVEIAPAVDISQKLRENICNDAVKLCKAIGYRNAGTVEFLVDKNEQHYFMECNTRIQVEHTVTEEITGVDIVGAQLQIAKGKSLKDLNLTQDQIQMKGCAIQLRLTTEDPAKDFAPDTGIIHSYIPGGGQGIRIDGNVYPGCEITPSYDSLLCKLTGRSRTFEECRKKLISLLKETQISGVKTNQKFLLNVLRHPVFAKLGYTTSFIQNSPELFHFDPEIDEWSNYLQWFGNFVVNRKPQIQGAQHTNTTKTPPPLKIPKEKRIEPQNLRGYKQILDKEGPEGLAKKVLETKKVLLTDTTMRDAHQSLLMTRMRTKDLLGAAEVTRQTHQDFFSLENWGGATFDVALRFLHEDPWKRLELLREAIPNVPFQCLLRGANAVGYTSYADNIVKQFCKQAVKSGMDVFRVFDSLNYIENMKLGLDAVGEAGGVIEGAICYTGIRDKYTLEYYVEFARQLVNHGIHFLAIKDMTGLLKPDDATLLIGTLKKEFPNVPLHLHMHDNAGAAVSSLFAAVNAGVDIIDVATDTMSGVTSQANMGTMASILKGHSRDPKYDANNDFGLNQYWGLIREMYSPFESPEKASFSDTYQHEMPGGQYTNLQFQAKEMGLATSEWNRLKNSYIQANNALGDIIKVTPSSKVVGDLANFMASNNLDKDQIYEKATKLNFPNSVLEYLQGKIGQPVGGFPEPFRSQVLKANNLEPINGRPGKDIPDYDFESEKKKLQDKYGLFVEIKDTDVLSHALYPDVFKDYCEFKMKYGELQDVPTEYLLRPLNQGEEVNLITKNGKPFDIELIGMNETNKETGKRKVIFKTNGRVREIEIQDEAVASQLKLNEKATPGNSKHIGAPIKSTVVEIKVKEGQEVKENQVVAVLTAMKMEMTVRANEDGKVKRILQKSGAIVENGDLLIETE